MAGQERKAPEKEPRKRADAPSDAKATDDFPTDGEEAQRRRDLMKQKDKAEGE